MALSRLSFSIIAIVMLFLGTANATTSTINPNVPAQNSLLQSSVVRGNFAAAYSDINNIYGLISAASRSLQFDPRAYGAICGGENTFAGNGVTKTFNYTIPFIGSTSTDNTGFMVFYENASGGGTATILNTAQFTVTGVNSGVGGTITLLGSPVPSGSVLIVAHDDSAGLVSASLSSTAVGGYVVAVDGCTIYGSQSTGTVLAEGTQLVGPNYTANYGYQGQGPKPILRVIAPTGFAPNFGINIGDKAQQAFKGFEITADVPGYQSVAFQSVPVLIGSNSTGGAGAGQVPGIVLENMTVNYGRVGFGAPIGGNSGYIFASVRNSNFLANNAGMYGPLSDLHLEGNDFASNGQFGSFGNSGGLVMGPAQAAPGAGGAGHSAHNRFEYNSSGAVMKAGFLMSFSDTEFDCNSQCGLDLDASWGQINITGGWFRCNGNNGAGGTGSTTPGQDAHICINGPGKNLHVENVNFLSGYARGYQAPIGSANANTPAYLLDVNTAGSGVDNISISGNAQGVAGNDGAYVTDFAIYRNGKPSNVKINLTGQAASGNTVNGINLAQTRGLPSNGWSSYYVFGDATVVGGQSVTSSSAYPYLLGADVGVGPTPFYFNDFSHFDCDVVEQKIFPNYNPEKTNNPLVTWLSGVGDPTYGGGFYQGHLADTNTCRLAALTWMSIPKQLKTYAQNTTDCIATGSWSNISTYPQASGSIAYGLKSQTNGDGLSCAIDTSGGPVYLWYQMNGSNGGTFTYSLDGGPNTTVATQGNNQFTFPLNSSIFTVGAVRIPAFSTGTHTVTIGVTSSTSSSNTVGIYGVGTPPSKTYAGGGATVFIGGQLYESGDAQSAATAAFDRDEKNQAEQLYSDGLPVNFVDIRSRVNSTTSMGDSHASGYPLYPSATGHRQIAEAFGGMAQYQQNSMNAINPKRFGAACNTIQLTAQYVSNGGGGSANNIKSILLTAGSNVIVPYRYIFQPGVATQFGGGDVGKVISIFYSGAPVKTTYIASVDTSTNTATIGETSSITTTFNPGANDYGAYAVIGGYPINPNDPSTAHDDTAAIAAASQAASALPQSTDETAVSGTGGGVVFLPPNCLVHNLNLAPGTQLTGNMGGVPYTNLQGFQSADPNATPTPLYIASTGFGNDAHIGIKMAHNVRLKDFTLFCATFPYLGFQGLTLAGIGSESFTSIDAEGLLIDHVSAQHCPVGVGAPLGLTFPVVFTASISGTSMTVSAITSTNFSTEIIPNTVGYTVPDWLAVGRAVTGGGVAANTVITGGPGGGGPGVYTVNNSQTVTSTGMTSPAISEAFGGQSRFMFLSNNGIGMSGDLSDWGDFGSTWSGNFTDGLYIGPNVGGSTGNAANQFNSRRFEENGNAVTCNGCGVTQFGNVQWQFNGGYAIRTIGTWNNIQVTGGMLQGNGLCADGSNSPQIGLGGTGTDFNLTGVQAYKPSYSPCGSHGNGDPSKYLIQTITGANVDYVSINGGDVRNGFSVAPFLWTGTAPTHYQQKAAGLPDIDTTVGYTATGCGASAPKGGASSGLVTASTTGSCSLTLTLPSNTNGWNCSGNDNTLGGAFTKSSGSSTTCVLTGTTTGGSTIGFQAAPIGGP